jgi:hypothetical protein
MAMRTMGITMLILLIPLTILAIPITITKTTETTGVMEVTVGQIGMIVPIDGKNNREKILATVLAAEASGAAGANNRADREATLMPAKCRSV